MSAWDDFYRFWVSEQTLPGNILGDVLIGTGALIIGRFKIKPWVEKHHRERLEQQERHHRELLASHHQLLASHQELLASHERLADKIGDLSR